MRSRSLIKLNFYFGAPSSTGKTKSVAHRLLTYSYTAFTKTKKARPQKQRRVCLYDGRGHVDLKTLKVASGLARPRANLSVLERFYDWEGDLIKLLTTCGAISSKASFSGSSRPFAGVKYEKYDGGNPGLEGARKMLEDFLYLACWFISR